MKQYQALSFCLLCMAMVFSSCELVEGVFKAGFWSAIVLVVLVVVLILWLVRKTRG